MVHMGPRVMVGAGEGGFLRFEDGPYLRAEWCSIIAHSRVSVRVIEGLHSQNCDYRTRKARHHHRLWPASNIHSHRLRRSSCCAKHMVVVPPNPWRYTSQSHSPADRADVSLYLLTSADYGKHNGVESEYEVLCSMSQVISLVREHDTEQDAGLRS